ncbi:hypothetical protein [Edaphobacter dinghuensis]|uniref:Uncharacterized protein n=1 Tax=Edaphobacter dinghuensis TaxID=1560005 RepID=A0A917MBA8_9BACT|nr:hypothetical protein [Edaphobacter dinghuensis]GGG86913.1 hypothetical protein GCM10011585_33630 [Edaphobacter dinghuensis]
MGINGELLFRLCVTLVERKLVDESLWPASGKIPVVFARNAIQAMIDRTAGEAFKDNLQYVCVVSDTLGSGYFQGASIEAGKLVAMFDLDTAGYLIIGEAMKALDEEEEFLGAGFYIALTRALRRQMLVYDHVTATWYNEQLHEMMIDDDPENRDGYEFPTVEEHTPPSVKIVEQWEDRKIRRFLRRHRNGPHKAWIEKLFTIQQLAHLRTTAVDLGQEYDGPPVPSVLIVFREQDAIQACWDEESPRYNEADNEPTCAVYFRPDDPKEFDGALRTMHIFLKLNIELAGLINMLNTWEEEQHARQRQHRTEPALRAA